jgi:hypothetical protein
MSYLSRVLCAEDERRNDTMDIGGWLRGLGLERYEQAFRENEIDLRVLPELTADDLKELGVAALGHRRLLLKASADLAAPWPSMTATNSRPCCVSIPGIPMQIPRKKQVFSGFGLLPRRKLVLPSPRRSFALYIHRFGQHSSQNNCI